MKKFYQLLSLKAVLIILLLIIIHFSNLLEIYYLTNIYIVLLVLYFYRHKKGTEIKNINKFFRLYTWFLIVFFAIAFAFYYLYLGSWDSTGAIILELSLPLAIIILLFSLLKINSYFTPIAERKKYHINIRLIFSSLLEIITIVKR